VHSIHILNLKNPSALKVEIMMLLHLQLSISLHSDPLTLMSTCLCIQLPWRTIISALLRNWPCGPLAAQAPQGPPVYSCSRLFIKGHVRQKIKVGLFAQCWCWSTERLLSQLVMKMIMEPDHTRQEIKWNVHLKNHAASCRTVKIYTLTVFAYSLLWLYLHLPLRLVWVSRGMLRQ